MNTNEIKAIIFVNTNDWNCCILEKGSSRVFLFYDRSGWKMKCVHVTALVLLNHDKACTNAYQMVSQWCFFIITECKKKCIKQINTNYISMNEIMVVGPISKVHIFRNLYSITLFC